MEKFLFIVFAGAVIVLVFTTFFQDSHYSNNSDEHHHYQAINIDNWQTDFTKSLLLAKESKKNIFMIFTGSDWCPPCKMLGRNVLDTETFKRYAQDNFELLYLDFPRDFRLSDEQRKHNDDLYVKYEVSGYPTVIILNSEGAELGRMSYYGEFVERFIQRYEESILNKLKEEE